MVLKKIIIWCILNSYQKYAKDFDGWDKLPFYIVQFQGHWSILYLFVLSNPMPYHERSQWLYGESLDRMWSCLIWFSDILYKIQNVKCFECTCIPFLCSFEQVNSK